MSQFQAFKIIDIHHTSLKPFIVSKTASNPTLYSNTPVMKDFWVTCVVISLTFKVNIDLSDPIVFTYAPITAIYIQAENSCSDSFLRPLACHWSVCPIYLDFTNFILKAMLDSSNYAFLDTL